MKPQLREQLGKAVYEAGKNGWSDDWSNVSPAEREIYMKCGEAAVQEFLAPIMPTIHQVITNLVNVYPDVKATIVPLVEELQRAIED